nr:MAG TPA: hypothetical protein [Caudoviricetes sp.]
MSTAGMDKRKRALAAANCQCSKQNDHSYYNKSKEQIQ